MSPAAAQILGRTERVRFRADRAPMLLVVVDTEEEFDWAGGYDRRNDSVEAMAHVGPFQSLCDEFGIRPVYVIDYPVANKPEGFEPLRRFADAGRAVIGAHLHPWVNPPFEEEPSPRLSYPGNLPAALEREKLAALTDVIERRFDRRPELYKAGRYGLGPRTAGILEQLGYAFDLSVCPRIDLGEDGGPDYRACGAEPFRFGSGNRLFGIPVTCEFVGALARAGSALTGTLHHPSLRRARLPGIFSRLGLLERLRLSPEGMDAAQHRRLTTALLARGVRTFTFSFHSPSLMPGGTPYVRDREQLARFLATCRDYFAWFLGELGGVPATPADVRAAADGEAGR